MEAFLGRARYQRAATVTAADGDEEQVVVRPGHRNGHCPTTIKTTSGPITVARPKLRGTTEKFPPASSAPASPAPTPSRRWSSPPSCVACRCATSNARWPMRSARKPR
ncbi:hypothetical protein GCM10010404_31430 [Nonomuraea africana]